MASDIIKGLGKLKAKKNKVDENKKLSNLAFAQAFSCKFVSKLIKPKIISSIFLNFGNLLKRNIQKINLSLKKQTFQRTLNTPRT